MSITTEFIRNQVENQTYEISLHADDERLADALTISQLEFVLTMPKWKDACTRHLERRCHGEEI